MSALVTDGLRWWAQNAPDRPAFVFDGHDVVDYRTMERWTDNAAHFLADRGLGRGDRVGVIGSNSLEWCVSALGALKLGAVVVPYNNRFLAPELEYLIDNSEPRIVLADEDHRGRAAEALGGRSIELISLAEFTGLREAEHTPVERLAADPDDPITIVYTSGTTSRPKGVVFTHRTTIGFIDEFAMTEPAMRPGARMIYVLSMAGAPGILWHVIQPLTRGVTMYYERGFDPKTTLRRLVDEKIQLMMGVPVLYEQMAALPDFADADLSSLEFASVAGARVSVQTIQTYLDKGVLLRQAYGMTELGGLSSLNTPQEAVRKPESFGRGGMYSIHRVVRPDGTDCEPGEPGEIIVKGPGVTPGYWRDEEATAAAIRDGWFHAGDIGVKDEDGYIRMIDRMKDMIISGGFNIAPSEVEAAIVEIPGVEEVCVIAVDDDKFGETVAAVVHASQPLTAEKVVEHCNERLAGYKVPRYVTFADRPLARMASGKIARREIKETYADLPRTQQKVR